MNPNNDRQGGDVPQAVGQTPVSQPGSSPVPQTVQSPSPSSPVQQAAAANVLRSQIDALYGDSPVAEPQPAPATQQQVQTAANPYDRTHEAHPQPQAEQWKQYHSAWQNYYQQYYEGYYAQQKAIEEQQRQHAAATNQSQEAHSFFGTQAQEPTEDGEITKDQALFDLRQRLLGQVRSRATKIRKSRHFIPVVASLAVVLVFVFLQYNQVLFAAVNAYVSPGAIDPQNIVINPGGEGVVGEEPRLIIPKINVDVPALYDVGADYNSQMAAMQKGVAHFPIQGANSHPGEIGNTVLSGHSSNDLFDPGDYKFIFAQLDKLAVGDTIYANYKGKRYTYVVTKAEVVKPTEVSKLVYPTDKPVMTLITCTPLGTSLNRLLVTAEQVSPDPASAAPAPTGSGDASGDNNATIPGASAPTLLERIFGAR